MPKRNFLKPLLKIVGKNPQYIADFIIIFLDELPASLDNLKKQIEKKNWLQIEKAAHHAKATVRVMGLEHLKLIAERIERNARDHKFMERFEDWFEEFREGCEEPTTFFKEELENLRAQAK